MKDCPLKRVYHNFQTSIYEKQYRSNVTRNYLNRKESEVDVRGAMSQSLQSSVLVQLLLLTLLLAGVLHQKASTMRQGFVSLLLTAVYNRAWPLLRIQEISVEWMMLAVQRDFYSTFPSVPYTVSVSRFSQTP